MGTKQGKRRLVRPFAYGFLLVDGAIFAGLLYLTLGWWGLLFGECAVGIIIFGMAALFFDLSARHKRLLGGGACFHGALLLLLVLIWLR